MSKRNELSLFLREAFNVNISCRIDRIISKHVNSVNADAQLPWVLATELPSSVCLLNFRRLDFLSLLCICLAVLPSSHIWLPAHRMAVVVVPALLPAAAALSTAVPRWTSCDVDLCSGCASRCFGGLPLFGSIAGSICRSGSAFTGFNLSTLTLSSLSPHCMTKYLSFFWRTLYGPVYGVCNGPCAASRLTKTYSASSNPFVMAVALVPCHASGAGTRRPATLLILPRCSAASGLPLGPTKVPGTVNVDPYTISATDVPKSSFGMVLSPSMTQGSSSIHEGIVNLALNAAFNDLWNLLDQAVRLWMVGRGVMNSGSQRFRESFPHV